jgi:alkylation response protein AidB-like acyl-CoA dehydrogenase
VEGGWRACVAALTEPEFDYYPQGMRTVAQSARDGYWLDGVKTMVPFAERAESFLVYAQLEHQPQAFIVPAGAEGLRIGEREDWSGINALPTFGLRLEGVHVTPDARLGEAEGSDFGPLLAAYQVANAALALGLSRAAYEYSLAYAKERVAFGGPIAQKQSIAFMLAEMATEIEAIRLLIWEAAWMLDEGQDAGQSAYLALSGASDMAMMVTDRAVQILGGHGYIREHPVELWMRNGRGVANFTGLAMV